MKIIFVYFICCCCFSVDAPFIIFYRTKLLKAVWVPWEHCGAFPVSVPICGIPEGAAVLRSVLGVSPGEVPVGSMWAAAVLQSKLHRQERAALAVSVISFHSLMGVWH